MPEREFFQGDLATWTEPGHPGRCFGRIVKRLPMTDYYLIRSGEIQWHKRESELELLSELMGVTS